jgi:hypothetical protein
MKVIERKTISVLSPELAGRMQKFVERVAAINSGYAILTDWHPVIPPGWGEHPRVPFARARVYSGEAATFAYSHHQTICRYGDRYVVSWSNGLLHEDYPGQEVHYAWSHDGLNWSLPRVLVHTPVESRQVRNNAGLLAWNDRLYCFVGVATDFGRESAAPGMVSLVEPKMSLDVYETTDLETWSHHPAVDDAVYLFEAPRPTRDGKLLCAGFALKDRTQGLVLLWDAGMPPTSKPRVVRVPRSPHVEPEQGTWYQTDDGTIYLLWRDGTWSGTLALSISRDGGETWTAPERTDMQNTFSRAYAGRLTDGRYYVVGNNYNILLDRRHLLIALSDDGQTFDRMLTLVDGPTTRRINGRHKEDGYHYPNCLAFEDHLLVTYSVNKEDIEVGMVKIGDLK